MTTNTAPFETLKQSLGDVRKLLGFHTALTGSDRGRRYDVDILNRSGIVLVVAAWEAFVEDLASAAFDQLLASATSPSVFPNRVLTLAGRPLREDKDERRIWDLSVDGWRGVLRTHKQSLLVEFHSPRPEKVDSLMERLFGLPAVSSSWSWHKNRNQLVRSRFESLIDLRGTIAHRLSPERYVQKHEVRDALELIGRAAAITQNRVSRYVGQKIGGRPWREVSYGSAG